MLNSFNAIIFDMDGTLVDSEGAWVRLNSALVAKFGDGKKLVNTFGMPAIESARTIVQFHKISLTPEEFARQQHEAIIEVYRDGIELMPCAKDAVISAHSQGLKLAVATSSRRELLDAFLEHQQFFRDVFLITVTGPEVARGKPAPDIFIETAKGVGVAPSECLVFEDSVFGVQAAKAAGMYCAAIVDERYNKREDFVGVADEVFGSLCEYVRA